MQKVKRFQSNTKGRDFVVGDLHGCIDLFNLALEKLEFNPAVDRMFSVGDLVDRGPKLFETLQLYYEPWFHPVKGNHEDMMIGVFHGVWAEHNYFYNGGHWFMQLSDEEKREAVDIALCFPTVIVIEGEQRFNIVHAELLWESDHSIDNGFTETQSMIWGRTITRQPQQGDMTGLSPTICGHTVVPHIWQSLSHIFIDTGAVFDRKLSIAELGKQVNIHQFP